MPTTPTTDAMQALIQVLYEKRDKLNAGIVPEWRYPLRTPRKPLSAVPKSKWPVFKPGPGPWKKNGRNWFYADVKFPKTSAGITVDGCTAMLFVHGWMPFTLWIDGQEIFKEEHAWLATGPITEPLRFKARAGEKHRLVACIEPTELPGGSIMHNVQIGFQPCIELAADIGAAAAQLEFAQVLADNDADRACLGKAVAGFDAELLKKGSPAQIRKAITQLERTLKPFSKRARSITTHLIGHSHIDMDWLWTWADTENCIRRDFKAVTDLMEDYPDLTFTHSQVPTYEVAQHKDPEVFAKVKKRVKEGRWENAAATWVEGDLNMADGESVARHFLYAADWTKQNLGSKSRVLWEPDTFGHPGNMPQLARLAEIDCYFHTRCNPGNHEPWPVREWVGIDGTSLPTFSRGYNNVLSPQPVIAGTLESVKRGFKTAFHVWGIGDHGGALSRFQLELLARYRNKPVMPTFEFSTMPKLLAAVQKEGRKLPRNQGETHQLFEGCFTTHAAIKRYNRQCETALLTAEALSAVAGLDRNEKLRNAWTSMLFNHFHDIFDGAAVHDTYINANARAERTLKMANEVTDEAMQTLIRPTADGRTLVLFNPCGFERTEPVSARLKGTPAALRDSDGRLVPLQKCYQHFVFIAEKVPAFGFKTYEILPELSSDAQFDNVEIAEEDGFFILDTTHARLKIDRESGAIGSYYDKRLCRQLDPEDDNDLEFGHHDLVAYGVGKPTSLGSVTRADLALNVFQMIDEAPNGMSAWHINKILREENLVTGARVLLRETGPVFARISVTHKIRASQIREDIIVYRDFPRIDFQAEIDWREIGNKEQGVPQLKVSFVTSMREAKARFEGPFTVVERPADGLEQPTQKFLDLTGAWSGFTLLNDSKYGCDALGGRGRITLLRNSYDPDMNSDNGRHKVSFAFMPHGPEFSNADAVRAGMAFNRPMLDIATQTVPAAESGPVALVAGSPIVITGFRQAEHSDGLLVRLFETSGKPRSATLKLSDGMTKAREVNFLENPVGDVLEPAKQRLKLNFRPFEVKTLLLED